MVPRVELAILKLIEEGHLISKIDASTMAFCHNRTAQRILGKLHAEGRVIIKEWQSIYHQKIPVYGKGPGKNKPKPKPITNKARMRRNRKDPEFCMNEAFKKRHKRFLKRQSREREQNSVQNDFVRALHDLVEHIPETTEETL